MQEDQFQAVDTPDVMPADTTAPDIAPDNLTDNTTAPVDTAPATRRQQWEQAIRAKHPDKTYDDEDELYGDAMAGYDEIKGNLSRYEEDDRKLVELLEQHPDVMNFLSTLTSTGDFASAYAELPDFAQMDDDERASYDRAVAGKRQALQAERDRESARMTNVERSAEVLQQWADKNGLTPEQVTDFIDTVINKIADRFNSGDFDEDFFETFYRIMNYDNDIEASREAGVIDGRNQAIGQRAKRRAQGDGLPEMTSGGGEQLPDNTQQDNSLAATLSRSLDRNAIHRFNS